LLDDKQKMAKFFAFDESGESSPAFQFEAAATKVFAR
jgi:hypothetical protein